MRYKIVFAALIGLVCVLALSPAWADNMLVLSTAEDELDLGTTWRYYETWQDDVIRLDDKSLMPVDVFADKAKGGALPKKADKIYGSAFPPANWRQADFDDANWVRQHGPMPNVYRSLAMVCLRGKFQVTDPAGVKELKLSLVFQGGAVAYLNGKEIGRSALPAGTLTDSTMADDYPHDTFVDAKNALLITPFEYGRLEPLAVSDPRGQTAMRDPDKATRIKQRARTLEVTIPADQLKKGLNLLAVEIHRAPGEAILFTGSENWLGHYYQPTPLWNRCQVESLQLKATAGAGAVQPNVSRPAGLQVWDEDLFASIRAPHTGMMHYADPSEPPATLKLLGVRNGVCSGQLAVGLPTTIKGLKATVSLLTGEGGTIPAAAVEIAYLDTATGALEPNPPAEVAPPTQFGRTQVKPAAVKAMGAIQPVWLTVKVPADAKPGVYSGTMTIAVDGQKPVATPVQLTVAGQWVCPAPDKFRTWVVAHESPDSVAMQYNVPLWSDEHWKHLDRVYALMAQIGVKDIHLPLIAKTHLANEQSMVRWIKNADGSYDQDFTVFEKYLDLAVKHLGKVPIVCVYLHDYGFRVEQSHGDTTPIVAKATLLDKATGKVSEFEPPAWGTPEAKAFWKPVIEKARASLAKRGLEKSMYFGIAANNSVLPACVADLKALAPDIKWVNRTHYYMPKVGVGANQQDVGFTANVGPALGVYWNPDAGQSHYAWRNPPMVVHFPRQGNVYGAVFQNTLECYRIFAEGIQLMHGQVGKTSASAIGVGHIGADFWPVMKDPKGGGARSMGDRYVFWHSLSLSEVIPYILAPGSAGAVSCPRLQMMRESLQEAEARMFVQDALLDQDKAAKLGGDLAKRCTEICNQRTQVFRYISSFAAVDSHEDLFRFSGKRAWDIESEKLFQAAGEVAKALGSK